MAANTATWSLTYPQSTDDVRPYEDIQELAQDVDTALTTVNSRITAGAGTPPQCIARRVATQSVASGGGGTSISFDTEDTDTDAMFAPTSATITIKTAGKYQVNVYGELPGTGQVVQVNHGATIRARQDSQRYFTLVTPVFAALVNDTIGIGVFQSSGSAQNLTAAVSVIKVSD